MLVDDSSICNLIMRKVLSQLLSNIDVQEFTDPLAAFSRVSDLNPSVIFLDLNMPGLDGWRFLEQMNRAGLTNRVVVLTSSTSMVDRSRCAEFPNILSYQTKPMTKDTLGALLRTFQTELTQ